RLGRAAHRAVLDVGRQLDAVRVLVLEEELRDLREGGSTDPPATVGLLVDLDPELEDAGRQQLRAVASRLELSDEPAVRVDRGAQPEGPAAPGPRRATPLRELSPAERCPAVDAVVDRPPILDTHERVHLVIPERSQQDPAGSKPDRHVVEPPTQGGRKTLRSGTI